jgi:transposase-like protein
MVQIFAEAMSADADVVCGAGYGQRSPDRMNIRDGYRWRGWDTRAGSIELAVPKLREGSYFPDWLLERRRRAESALVSVVAPAICSVSAPAGWRSWSRPWASPGCRSRRS